MADSVVGRHARWMALRGRSTETIYSRTWLLARIERRARRPLLELTAADLLAWRESLAVDRDTVRVYVSNVRQFYRWARREGLRDDDPSLDIPVPPRRRRLPRPIGEQELVTALASAPPRIRPWLALAGWAGLRAKEIALLRRENVHLYPEPGGIHVATDATKGANERYVSMHPVVLQALREHGLPATGYIFRRGDDQPGPNYPHTISHLCNRYLHGIGIPDTLHALRHRFATQHYLSGNNIQATARALGHQTTEPTSGYVAITDVDQAEIIARIPGPGYLTLVRRNDERS